MDKIVKRAPTCLKCMDCGATVRLSRRDTWKASRPKCMGCGSTRLEPTTKEKEEKKEETTTPEPEKTSDGPTKSP